MDINKKLAEVVYIRKDQLNKARTSPFLCEVGPNERADKEPIYTADQLAAAVAAERERAAIIVDAKIGSVRKANLGRGGRVNSTAAFALSALRDCEDAIRAVSN